ncbi:hypothetical protein ABZT26_36145 [Streptomyces sp. NPDC005395]|uniref:hypothetical protein n=1 Tax=Streptomyces sp. NPDC005395 TaxID=3157042 RepID=UPI0033B341DB
MFGETSSDYYFVTRRSDGLVSAVNGSRPRDFRVGDTETTYELIAESTDWDRARGVILVERANPRIETGRRYRAVLTVTDRVYPWTKAEDIAPPAEREWEVDGAQLRDFLWECAAGSLDGLPDSGMFDDAEADEAGDFTLRGVAPNQDLRMAVSPA